MLQKAISTFKMMPRSLHNMFQCFAVVEGFFTDSDVVVEGGEGSRVTPRSTKVACDESQLKVGLKKYIYNTNPGFCTLLVPLYTHLFHV